MVEVKKEDNIALIGTRKKVEKEEALRRILSEKSKVVQSGTSGTLVLCALSITENSSDKFEDNIMFMVELEDIEESYPKGKIYLSGPISYNPSEARGIFDRAEIDLRGQGWDVINPFSLNHKLAIEMESEVNIFSEEKVHKEYMRICVDALLVSDCDNIIMLDKWQESEGANIELFLALKYQYNIYSYPSFEIIEIE